MTSRERFLASLTCRRVDRFFRYEHGPWPSTLQRWIAEGYPADTSFETCFAMDPLRRIGIQSGYTDSPYYPKFEVKTVEETGSCRVYVDGEGILKREFKTASDTSMPQFMKFPVASRQDWAMVREQLNPADAPLRVGDPAALRAGELTADVPTMMPICGAFGHPRNLFGDDGLSYLIFDDPALLEDVLDNWLALYVALVRKLIRHIRVDTILIWKDMCYRNGPLVSPDHFRQFMLPRYREFIAEARRCGVKAIIVDTNGDCRKLIPLFLDAGVDALLPFEVQAGMDVTRVRRDFPTLDHTVPPNVSLENFWYYLECVRAYE